MILVWLVNCQVIILIAYHSFLVLWGIFKIDNIVRLPTTLNSRQPLNAGSSSRNHIDFRSALPAGHSTFLSRMNEQGLAVTLHRNSAVLPTISPARVNQRHQICTGLDLHRRRSYGTSCKYYPYSIVYSVYFFGPLYWRWRPKTLSYSFYWLILSYKGGMPTYSSHTSISLQTMPYHVHSLPQRRFSVFSYMFQLVYVILRMYRSLRFIDTVHFCSS